MQVSTIIGILKELDPDMNLNSKDLELLLSSHIPSREEIENICSARNLDVDCNLIDTLLGPALLRVEQLLEDVRLQPNAVRLFLMIIEVLQDHFIKDEHWCWYDDCYSPDYSLQSTFEQIKRKLDAGALCDEASTLLTIGLNKASQHEACTGYSMPSFL